MKIKQNIGKFFALNLCLLSADPSAFGMNSPTDSEEEGLDLSEINQKFTFGFKTTNSEDEDSGIKQFEIDFSQNPGMTSSEEEDSGLSYADSKAQEDLMFSRPLLYLIINYRNIFQQSGMDGCKQKMVDVLADHHASLFGNLFHNYDINTIKSILSGTHRGYPNLQFKNKTFNPPQIYGLDDGLKFFDLFTPNIINAIAFTFKSWFTEKEEEESLFPYAIPLYWFGQNLFPFASLLNWLGNVRHQIAALALRAKYQDKWANSPKKYWSRIWYINNFGLNLKTHPFYSGRDIGQLEEPWSKEILELKQKGSFNTFVKSWNLKDVPPKKGSWVFGSTNCERKVTYSIETTPPMLGKITLIDTWIESKNKKIPETEQDITRTQSSVEIHIYHDKRSAVETAIDSFNAAFNTAKTIAAAGKMNEEQQETLRTHLAGFLYDWSWSSTYARGQAAVLLWIARGLVLSAGYTLKLNNNLSETSPFPFDVLALLTPDKATFVKDNSGSIVFAPIQDASKEI